MDLKSKLKAAVEKKNMMMAEKKMDKMPKRKSTKVKVTKVMKKY
jgi:hypothetical protein